MEGNKETVCGGEAGRMSVLRAECAVASPSQAALLVVTGISQVPAFYSTTSYPGYILSTAEWFLSLSSALCSASHIFRVASLVRICHLSGQVANKVECWGSDSHCHPQDCIYCALLQAWLGNSQRRLNTEFYLFFPG